MSADSTLVVVVGTRINTDLSIERDLLEPAGARVVDARELTTEQAHDLLSEATAVLTEGFFEFDFAAMPRCRAISMYAIGVDAVDVSGASKAGIAVMNSPGYCINEVADHAIMLLLAVWRKLEASRAIAVSANWELGALRPIRRLSGRTLGLIGFGAIARAAARRARAFGLRTVAYDAYVDAAVTAQEGVELRSLDDVLAASDAISLHVPLTDETAGLIGADQLALLRPGALVVSTSRGGVINEKALLDALDRGHVAGAGLDVLASEPPTSETSLRLATHPRVVCTPHMAYYSEDAVEDLRRTAAGSLVAFLRGESPPFVVNAAAVSANTVDSPTEGAS